MHFSPLYRLKSEIDKFHHEGTHVPQLETRFSELKQQLKAIIHADEVDPRNEWAIKANELL